MWPRDDIGGSRRDWHPGNLPLHENRKHCDRGCRERENSRRCNSCRGNVTHSLGADFRGLWLGRMGGSSRPKKSWLGGRSAWGRLAPSTKGRTSRLAELSRSRCGSCPTPQWLRGPEEETDAVRVVAEVRGVSGSRRSAATSPTSRGRRIAAWRIWSARSIRCPRLDNTRALLGSWGPTSPATLPTRSSCWST